MSLLPPRTTLATLELIAPATNWSEDDRTNDPWIGMTYRWQVRLLVTPQAHASHLTRTPFRYTAADVRPGDWFADFAGARAVRIVAINTVSDNALTAVVEDTDRYNTFADPAASGVGIGTGSGAIFALGLDGLPVIAGLSGRCPPALSANPVWLSDLTTRFRYRGASQTVPVVQAGHSLAPGDLIGLTRDGYARLDRLPAGSALVGSVLTAGIPLQASFEFLPTGRLLAGFAQDLPGLPGDSLYASPSGLTAERPTRNARPVLLRLDGARRALLIDRSVETAGPEGYAARVFTVETANDRDRFAGLNPGDLVFVRDDGNGEWATYLFSTEDGFIQIATQDIASVTPGRQSLMIACTSPASAEFARLSYGARVVEIAVEVLETFDGTASFSVRNANDGTVLVDPAESDLSALGTYVALPAYEYRAGSEASIQYQLDVSSSTKGLLRVSISYL